MAEIQGANIVKLVTKQAGRAKEKVSMFSNFSTCKDLCIQVKTRDMRQYRQQLDREYEHYFLSRIIDISFMTKKMTKLLDNTVFEIKEEHVISLDISHSFTYMCSHK